MLKKRLLILCVAAGLFAASFPIPSLTRAADRPSVQSGRGWMMTGPFGGDVRSLQVDPRSAAHLLLGTADGQIFESADAAETWRRLLPGIGDESLGVEEIIFDPSQPGAVYAALQGADDTHGGVYKSFDSGRNWRSLPEIAEHSVRALAMWKGDPHVLVAGAIDGVFRTSDGGQSWQRISPAGHSEIKNVDSVAIDPNDPNVIYAGTFHLPWKTTDGGRTWFSIKNGIIDDSDIFTIELEPANPSHAFASACSGIYETSTAGAEWKKVLGIPATSRRTYAIKMLPGQPEVIFAGTSEGLWRTPDAGKSWNLLTSKSLVVNCVVVIPEAGNRLIIGTDDAGVLLSDNLGATFSQRNSGFVHRQMTAVKTDIADPARVYAGVAFDGEYGGFFISDDAGMSWRRSAAGLSPRDVLSLYQDPGRPSLLYAGTNDGLFRSIDRGATWQKVLRSKTKVIRATPPARPAARARTVPAVSVSQRAKGKPRSAKKKSPRVVLTDLGKSVFQIARNPQTHELFAATWDGLFRSVEPALGWQKMPLPGRVNAAEWVGDEVLLAGTPSGMFFTRDLGATWVKPAGGISREPVLSILNDEIHRAVYAGTNHSLYRSLDGGKSWVRLAALPYGQFFTILPDPHDGEVIIASDASPNGLLYRTADGGISWTVFTDAPSLRWASATYDLSKQGRFFAGTRGSGVLVFEGHPVFAGRGLNLK